MIFSPFILIGGLGTIKYVFLTHLLFQTRLIDGVFIVDLFKNYKTEENVHDKKNNENITIDTHSNRCRIVIDVVSL